MHGNPFDGNQPITSPLFTLGIIRKTRKITNSMNEIRTQGLNPWGSYTTP